MRKVPEDDQLESLIRMQLRESNQLKSAMELYGNEVLHKGEKEKLPASNHHVEGPYRTQEAG